MREKLRVLGALLLASIAVQAVTPLNWTVIKSENNWDLDMTSGGSLVWGDFNNDGWIDAFVNTGNERVHLYRNNGNGDFTKIGGKNDPVLEGFFKGLQQGYSVFIDYNNDGYLDLVTTGKADAEKDKKYTIFYRNTGEAGGYVFEIDDVNSATIPGMISDGVDRVGHMLNAVDIDNDGWIDLVVSGNISGTHPLGIENTGRLTAVYKNVNGVFQVMKNNVDKVDGENFIQMAGGSIHVGDFNNDGLKDIVNIGYADNGIGYISALYMNTGNCNFSKVSYRGLDKNEECDIVFADMNGDGFDDMIEITRNVANIHISNGDGTFEILNKTFTGLVNKPKANITVGDVNNDGYNDIFTSCEGDDTVDYTRLYLNNGNNTFTLQQITPGARPGTANLVDMTNDMNLDASYYGWGSSNGWPNRFLRNDLGEGIASNTAPLRPENFKVIYSNDRYNLSWDKASDAETAQNALRYNVYAKDEETGMVYVYAPVDLKTGKLKIGGGIIPLIAKNSFEWALPGGSYTFGVQTVDQADVASEFTEKSVVTGLKENVFEGISVYSKNQQIQIINNAPSVVEYSVISVNGQLLYSDKCVTGSQQSLSVSEGTYIVKLINENGVSAVKVSVL